jgi:hypothetical protein
VLPPVDGEVLEVTIPAGDRLHHRCTTTMQMHEKIYLPLHCLRRAVAVVELQHESPFRGSSEDVVDRSAEVPQPNVVEVVPARHMTCEIDLGGDHLTRRSGAHGLNATDALPRMRLGLLMPDY